MTHITNLCKPSLSIFVKMASL